jgi:hypothetical protein
LISKEKSRDQILRGFDNYRQRSVDFVEGSQPAEHDHPA